jgi:uncharacterized membrane protein YgdD (TMEM256/DUF423 family)
MERVFFALGGVSAFLGVALGAFGAHSLKNSLSPEMLSTFEVGVRYQMYHALSLSGERWLGAVTPLGGIAFLAGWLCLAWAAWRHRQPIRP